MSGPAPTVMLTIATGEYATRYADCLAAQEAYAERNAYERVLIGDVEPGGGHVSAWLKVALIADLLTARDGWLLYLDADCEPTEECPAIETVATPEGAIFLAPGHSGRPNSGVIAARPDADVVAWLRTILEDCEQAAPSRSRTPYENGHFIEHLPELGPKFVLLDRAWNQTVAPSDGDHIRHYTGPMARHHTGVRTRPPAKPEGLRALVQSATDHVKRTNNELRALLDG